MNEEVGNFFRDEVNPNFDTRSAIDDDSACIVVVDPVLGSRLSLAQAVAQPSYIVKTASTVAKAISHLDDGNVSLIIAERHLGDCDGIEFLVEMRRRYPAARRALVVSGELGSAMHRAISRAGLSFMLNKPWNPKSVRETIRVALGRKIDFAGWGHIQSAASFDRYRVVRPADPIETRRQHEILLRGLLAGLNSCEFATEIFELLHAELAGPFRVDRWLWVDEERATATRVVGDWPVEAGVALESLSAGDAQLLSQARQSLRVTRLKDLPLRFRLEADRTLCISLAIRQQATRSMSCLVWADRSQIASLVAILRQLQTGLQMAFCRIRLAEERAIAARRLARRVAEELRTPVGALTHAIDRLRGEAKRAGLAAEWVDQVSSESERVVRAVEHLEGEILTDSLGISSTAY